MANKVYENFVLENKLESILSTKVDLSNYDFIIASPPCNYWSKANPYYRTSKYSLETKHLLPDIIEKLSYLNKPFIIENVKNIKRMRENGIFEIVRKNKKHYIL